MLTFVAVGILLGSLPSLRTGETRPSGVEAVRAPEKVERELFPIDVNRAGAELLEELPGIGPKKARAILALREELAGFRSIDELERVRGIGPRTVERLRGFAIVGERGRRSPAKRESAEGVVPATRDAADRERDPR